MDAFVISNIDLSETCALEIKELIGKDVAVIVNLQPAVIRGVESNGMLLAASDSEMLSILTLDKSLSSGSTIK